MANYLNAQGPPHSFVVLLLASHTWTVSPHQHLFHRTLLALTEPIQIWSILKILEVHTRLIASSYEYILSLFHSLLSLSFQQNCIEIIELYWRLITAWYSSWQSRCCGGRWNCGSFSFVSSCRRRCWRSALGDDRDDRLHPTRCALTPRGGFLSTWLHATTSRPTSITHHWHGHLHRGEMLDLRPKGDQEMLSHPSHRQNPQHSIKMYKVYDESLLWKYESHKEV